MNRREKDGRIAKWKRKKKIGKDRKVDYLKTEKRREVWENIGDSEKSQKIKKKSAKNRCRRIEKDWQRKNIIERYI